MRVIAGTYRSRVLAAPAGTATRPTSDRLRETLFNVLGERIRGARFADLFAGSGAVGIEALSRGAVHCTFAEQAPSALAALRKNLSSLGLAAEATICGRPVQRVLADAAAHKRGFDLVFLDPPYQAADAYTASLEQLSQQRRDLLHPQALVVAEHAKRYALRDTYGELQRLRVLTQGDATLSFFVVDAASTTASA